MSPILLAFAFLSLMSFSLKAAEKGIIRGKVIEEVGALPIPYAAVSLYEGTNEQTLSITQSDENGFFIFILEFPKKNLTIHKILTLCMTGV